jgi:dTDP-4-dehydrorhamnose reductase
MKILLTGAAGQLGQALRQQLPGGGGADRHQPQR